MRKPRVHYAPDGTTVLCGTWKNAQVTTDPFKVTCLRAKCSVTAFIDRQELRGQEP